MTDRDGKILEEMSFKDNSAAWLLLQRILMAEGLRPSEYRSERARIWALHRALRDGDA